GLMADDRFLADDEVGLAIGLLFESVDEGFIEVNFHLAAELFFEVLGELLVIALGVPLYAIARQRGGERVHHDQRERRLFLGGREGRKNHGKDGRNEKTHGDHDSYLKRCLALWPELPTT